MTIRSDILKHIEEISSCSSDGNCEFITKNFAEKYGHRQDSVSQTISNMRSQGLIEMIVQGNKYRPSVLRIPAINKVLAPNKKPSSKTKDNLKNQMLITIKNQWDYVDELENSVSSLKNQLDSVQQELSKLQDFKNNILKFTKEVSA